MAVQKWIAEKSRSEDIVEDGQINEKLDDDNDSYVKGIDLSPGYIASLPVGFFLLRRTRLSRHYGGTILS